MSTKRRYTCTICKQPMPAKRTSVQCKSCQKLSIELNKLHNWYKKHVECEADYEPVAREERVEKHRQRVEVEMLGITKAS